MFFMILSSNQIGPMGLVNSLFLTDSYNLRNGTYFVDEAKQGFPMSCYYKGRYQIVINHSMKVILLC